MWDGKTTLTRIGMEGICITHSCIPPHIPCIFSYCILCVQMKGPPILYLGVCIKKFCMKCSVSQEVLTNNYYNWWLAIDFKNAYQRCLWRPTAFRCVQTSTSRRSLTKDNGDHHSFHAEIADPRIAQSVEQSATRWGVVSEAQSIDSILLQKSNASES